MSSFENYQKGLLGAEAFGRTSTQNNVPEDFQAKAIRLVTEYINGHLEKIDPIPQYTTYVVWFSKTLKNWKAMVSTSLPDGMYYEVAYNGDAGETYLDAYKKFNNVRIPD